jgi:tRNA(adenine34) deaminase
MPKNKRSNDLHELFMHRCLELADIAEAAGESAVGCVVVKDGRIIGEAFEQSRKLKDVTRHAEVLAIINATESGNSCEGATIYSNVEPCILCSYVIRHQRLNAVVYLNTCGELGGAESQFPILKAEMKSWGNIPSIFHFKAADTDKL